MTKLKKLKKLFYNYKIDGYIIPKNDEFFGEYIHESKDNLKFISNFSGSYGLALILKKKNYLFVDGRYTLQAKIQSGKNFKIFTVPNKLPSDILKSKKIFIGFDPKLHTEKMLANFFKKTNVNFIPINKNLVSKVWSNKTTHQQKKFYKLSNKDAGESSSNKIKKISKILNKNKINLQFISSSENIAWLLNLRGADSEFTPMPNSYLVLDNKNNVHFFCNLKKITKQLKKNLKNIFIIDIKYIDQFLSEIKNKVVQLDSLSCSIFFKRIIKKKM